MGKLKRIFDKHHIGVHFKPGNTLRQTLVHPRDKPPGQNKSNVMYTVQYGGECTELYHGEAQLLFNFLAT